jgi:GNAT superfamily N-acetyltransferase
MNIRLQYNTSEIDWELIPSILKAVGMSFHDGKIHKIAFEKSHFVVFVFRDEQLIGFGRALSDGVYQAAIYDVAVLPEFQGNGIGKLIVNSIVENCPGCNFILYASPGKEKFYERFKFRKMKTGMALYTDIEKMKQKGFTE